MNLSLRVRRSGGGFTLAELMMALAVGSVAIAAALSGIVFLQKSYAATEQYALSMTDQMRVLDYVAMDLRRARPSGVDLTTANQVTITFPAYYSYTAADTTHQAPIPVLAVIASDSQHAVYSAGAGTSTPSVQYRFDSPTSQLLRRETYTDGANTGWVAVASQVTGFPDITLVAPQQYSISVSFAPTFQTLDTPVSNVIILTSTVYLRNS